MYKKFFAFQIQNTGRSNLGPTDIEIQWPMKTSDDDYLLYLVSATMATTMEACQVTNGGKFNPEGLTVCTGCPISNGHVYFVMGVN